MQVDMPEQLRDFILEYGMFLAKFGTVLLFVVILVAIVLILILRARGGGDEHLSVRNINQKFEHMQLLLESAILSKKEFKQSVKNAKAKHKKKDKNPEDDDEHRRVFVLDFKGDIRASEVASLREEISSLLTVAKENDEVVVLVESGGGTVHGYGLAASQLKRIRDKNIKLTVAVDKVAASGGYMMACVANHIIAAPFAILGSIGVLAQIPNFNKLLKKHDIDFEQISAGKYKRTLTMFGENTDADRIN
jgi:serine protease SohB